RRCDKQLADGNLLPTALAFIDDEFDGENERNDAENAQNAAARTGHHCCDRHQRQSKNDERTPVRLNTAADQNRKRYADRHFHKSREMMAVHEWAERYRLWRRAKAIDRTRIDQLLNDAEKCRRRTENDDAVNDLFRTPFRIDQNQR